MSEEDTPTEFGFETTPTSTDGAIPESIDEGITASHELPDMLQEARKRGYEAGAAEVVEASERAREEVIEACRQLFVIFELPFPDWPTAERWIRSRLPPI